MTGKIGSSAVNGGGYTPNSSIGLSNSGRPANGTSALSSSGNYMASTNAATYGGSSHFDRISGSQSYKAKGKYSSIYWLDSNNYFVNFTEIFHFFSNLFKMAKTYISINQIIKTYTIICQNHNFFQELILFFIMIFKIR